MKKTIIIILAVILSACGASDGDVVSSNPDNPTNSSGGNTTSGSSSSSSSTSSGAVNNNDSNSTPIANGARLFEERACSACHAGGALLGNLDALVESNTLANIISLTMPPANPASCIEGCATSLAAYLTNTFYTPIPNTGSNSSSSSSSSSNSSSSSSSSSSSNSSSSSSSSSSSGGNNTTWKHCANENETCRFEGTSLVRFGSGDAWGIRTFTDTVNCSATVFNEPDSTSTKTCQVPSDTVLIQTPITTDSAALFSQKGCAACHADGALLTNFDALVESGRVESTINNTMPPNAPNSCVGECASSLATYMQSLFYTPLSNNEIAKAAVPVESYLRKAKTLLTGSAITQRELANIREDADALPELIREWQNLPGYSEKLRWFLEENLQFTRNAGPNEYVGQLRGSSKANPPTKFVNPKIYENGQESAIRTIMSLIVEPNRPFTHIATQTEWMMTPALMSLFLAFDHPNDSRLLDFKIGVNLTDNEKNLTMTQKINRRRFYFPAPHPDGFLQQNGSRTKLVTRKEIAFVWGALNQFSHETTANEHRLFKNSDYTTWKKVKIAKATQNNPSQRFWDLPTLRQADTLYVNAERVGFFSHPNFLGRWETNDDNQFRLTINQTLITALNKSFAPDDVSITINEEALSEEHAAPGTDCYSCHRLVDPMRNYLRNNFDDTFGKPRTTIADDASSFSFGGQLETGSRLADLGRALATHPDFAPGWVQKLCFYANSQACLFSDPEFKRVAEAFEDSGFNFNELMVTFFSSDLIKKDIEERSEKAQPAFASISRQQHVCQLLSRRMSDITGNQETPCATGKANILADTIPADEWIRGALAPATPTRPNMFTYTTMENMCRNIALSRYNSTTMPSTPIDRFLDDYFLPDILGIPIGDRLRQPIRSVLRSHFVTVKGTSRTDASHKDALVSVFTLGCSSPILSSVDF